MLEVAYYGALRVSELVSLHWAQLLPRDSGEVQLELVGKGDKARQVLLPASLAEKLLATRCGAPATDLVFKSIRGGGIDEYSFNCVVKGCARRAEVTEGASAHWLRHAHASHALDNGAPISLVSATLGHADLKTTSVYAHARPNDSSSRYLKK
jgi:site-specific recombinase XerD